MRTCWLRRKTIRDKGILQNPVGGAYKAGWNIAQEFNNMYIGYGGEFFKAGTAEVSINNEKGRRCSENDERSFRVHEPGLSDP